MVRTGWMKDWSMGIQKFSSECFISTHPKINTGKETVEARGPGVQVLTPSVITLVYNWSSRDLTPSSGINSHALSKNKMSLFRNTANNHYSLHCCYICGTHLAQPKKWQRVRFGWGAALSGEPWAGSRAALQEEEEVAHSSDRPDPQDESP